MTEEHYSILKSLFGPTKFKRLEYKEWEHPFYELVIERAALIDRLFRFAQWIGLPIIALYLVLNVVSKLTIQGFLSGDEIFIILIGLLFISITLNLFLRSIPTTLLIFFCLWASVFLAIFHPVHQFIEGGQIPMLARLFLDGAWILYGCFSGIVTFFMCVLLIRDQHKDYEIPITAADVLVRQTKQGKEYSQTQLAGYIASRPSLSLFLVLAFLVGGLRWIVWSLYIGYEATGMQLLYLHVSAFFLLVFFFLPVMALVAQVNAVLSLSIKYAKNCMVIDICTTLTTLFFMLIVIVRIFRAFVVDDPTGELVLFALTLVCLIYGVVNGAANYLWWKKIERWKVQAPVDVMDDDIHLLIQDNKMLDR